MPVGVPTRQKTGTALSGPRHFAAPVNFGPTPGENSPPRLGSLSKQAVPVFYGFLKVMPEAFWFSDSRQS
jgi:hypothetical protein